MLQNPIKCSGHKKLWNTFFRVSKIMLKKNPVFTTKVKNPKMKFIIVRFLSVLNQFFERLIRKIIFLWRLYKSSAVNNSNFSLIVCLDRGSLDRISLDRISWSKVSNNLGVWSKLCFITWSNFTWSN